MAQIVEDVLVVKLSKLIKDTDTPSEIVSNDMMNNLQTVMKELAGEDVLVEIYNENNE
jgi:hypothetical protein